MCNEPEKFLKGIVYVGFCGFIASLPPKHFAGTWCYMRQYWWVLPGNPWISWRLLCYRLLPFYRTHTCHVLLGRNSDEIMGGTLVILQRLNIKIVYLWMTALEFLVFKIAAWVADLSFRKIIKWFCLEIGTEFSTTSRMTKCVSVIWYYISMQIRIISNDDYKKSKYLINSEKCWRCSL